MAIGRTFEEAIQKGVRMLDIGAHGVTDFIGEKPEQILIWISGGLLLVSLIASLMH